MPSTTEINIHITTRDPWGNFWNGASWGAGLIATLSLFHLLVSLLG